jgi:hypothetical protein
MALRVNYTDGGATPAATNITAADMNAISLAVNQLQQTVTAVKTTAYTAAANEFVPADGTTAAFTVTLPSAPADGTTVSVTQVDATSNAITISRGGTDVILAAGITSVVLESQGRTVTLKYLASATVWYVIASRDTPLTPGVVDQEQYITNTAARTLASQTAAQKIFGTPTNGQVTLPVGSFFFDSFFSLSAMSATSGSFGFALAGTAVLGGQLWQSEANKVATIATAAAAMNTTNTAANTALVTANTNTAGWAHVWGKFRVTTAGTIIPSVSLTVAAAAIVGADSWFRVWPLGASTVASVGNWS